MKQKFHINKNGMPAPCKAREGNCPLGGNESHFKTQIEAQEYIDSKNAKEFGILNHSGSNSHHKNRFQRLDIIVEDLGSEHILFQLKNTSSSKLISSVNKFILDTYKLSDKNISNGKKQLNRLAVEIGDEPVIYELAKRMPSNELHEFIDNIEKNNVKTSRKLRDHSDLMLEHKVESLEMMMKASNDNKESMTYLKNEMEEVNKELEYRSLK